MTRPAAHRPLQFVALTWLAALASQTAAAQRLAPIVYTISAPAPDNHIAVIEATFPTERKPAIDLMMPVWSPGFYRVEDYAGRIQELSARSADGTVLVVEQPQKNRWHIATGGADAITVTYRLLCAGRSVTTDYVGNDFGVFNGSATFITRVENARRPHEVRLELPPQWPQSASSLAAAPDGIANHYRADDYDTLNDSPILAGRLSVHEFTVDGSTHYLVDAGNLGEWDGKLAAQNLAKFVQANRALWGFLPFRKYVFLSLFRQGGGGLEHLNSTLLTSSFTAGSPGGTLRWLNFVSHEYFHAFNVKRLRPVELGPFDYEHPPRTSSLWISEGFTSYYGELLVARAGLANEQDYLASMSSHITSVQNSPGRLVQTLEQSSLDVWTAGTSGVGQDPNTTVSYYEKGPIVAFLLDARIRRLTNGRKSLDDAMRLAYKRYSGARGFTPAQFRATMEEVAGTDLQEWFRRAIGSTEELDYAEALEWYGLRFAPSDDATKRWRLEPSPVATDVQRAHLQALAGISTLIPRHLP
jgi:predicted metalloprotease with PDZ domain